MAIIIENQDTGERRVIQKCAKHGCFHLPGKPWKAVTTVRNEMIKAARAGQEQQPKPRTIH